MARADTVIIIDEPTVLRSFAAKSASPINLSIIFHEEADDQPVFVDYSPLLDARVAHSASAEAAAVSAENVATMVREQADSLNKYLEERRAAAENQRRVEESRRAQTVRVQFPRTPKCVKFGKHSRGGFFIEAR